MREQFTQIRILLANIQNNMSLMLDERESLIKELDRLRNENEQLKTELENVKCKNDTEKSA